VRKYLSLFDTYTGKKSQALSRTFEIQKAVFAKIQEMPAQDRQVDNDEYEEMQSRHSAMKNSLLNDLLTNPKRWNDISKTNGDTQNDLLQFILQNSKNLRSDLSGIENHADLHLSLLDYTFKSNMYENTHLLNSVLSTFRKLSPDSLHVVNLHLIKLANELGAECSTELFDAILSTSSRSSLDSRTNSLETLFDIERLVSDDRLRLDNNIKELEAKTSRVSEEEADSSAAREKHYS
jgi:hypothetical protein